MKILPLFLALFFFKGLAVLAAPGAFDYYQSAVNQEKNLNNLQAVKELTKAYEANRKDPAILTKLGLMYLNSDAVEEELRKASLQKAVEYFNKAQALKPNDPMSSLLLGKAHQSLAVYDEALKDYQKAVTLDPENTLLKFNLALLYFEKKEFKQAIELFNKVILAYPDNLKARGYLGAALQATDNYLAAIEQYNYVLSYQPNQFSILRNLTTCWIALNQYDKAEETCMQAMQLDPKVPDVYADIAFIEAKQAKHDKAADYYQKALALKPDAGDWRKALAYSLWADGKLTQAITEFNSIREYNVAGYLQQLLGNKEQAIASYQKALELNPNDTKTRFNLANLYHETKKSDLAKSNYEEVLKQKPNDEETMFLLAVLEQEQGATDKAIKYYNEILTEHAKQAPGTVSGIENNTYYNLGLAYKSKNDLKKAEENFQQVLTSSTQAPAFEKTNDLYKELSFIKIALNKNVEAEKLLNDWLRGDPTSVEARNLYADFLVHLSKDRKAVEQLRLAAVLDQTSQTRLKLANLLHRQNNFYDALSEYQIVLQNDPKNLNALLGAANNFKALGLRQEAQNLYQQAVAAYPNDVLANYNYGLSLQEERKLSEALTQYQKVETLDPNFVENYYVLGMAYWDLNQKDKALEVWQKFLNNSDDEKLKAEVRGIINEKGSQETKANTSPASSIELPETPEINNKSDELGADEQRIKIKQDGATLG